MDYVTADALGALLGPAADPDRIATAVAAANQLVGRWSAPDPAAPPPTEPTPVQAQAALELGVALYRRHAAAGGFVTVDDLVARLPAEVSRPVRELLDVDAYRAGFA